VYAALALMLLAGGLYLGFAPTYLDDLIPSHTPANCGSAFLPSDRCGSGVDETTLRVPAVAILLASAFFAYKALRTSHGRKRPGAPKRPFRKTTDNIRYVN
jgi:hypothetical protein